MRQWRILGKASLSNDIHTRHIYNSLMAQLLKNLPAKLKSFCHSGDPDSTLGSGRSSGEGNGNPASILAWRIPRTEEPGGLQSMPSQTVGHDWATNTHTHIHIDTKGSPGGAVVKNPPANAGDAKDTSLVPGLGRSHGVGNGNLLQYSCLGNTRDRGDVGYKE